MSGAVYIKGVAVSKYKRSAVKDEDEWPSKYSKFFIELENGLELSFTDKRRFARVRLLENPVAVPPISELGPDALLEPLTVDEFHQALSKKKIGIKALLLDQSFISGIGNWMADEVLYQARIHPMQITSSMSRESCELLLKCINEVTAFSVDVDADSSRFPSEWLFHNRWGKKPGKVNGKKIDFIVAGGRTTAYVPELQKQSGPQSSKASKKQEKSPKGDDVKETESDGNSSSDMKETRAKKPVGRTKEEGHGNRDEATKKKTGAKRKSGSDDVSFTGSDNENDSGTAKKPSKRTQTRAAETATKKATPGQNRKQSKKSK
ncbi:unnamed protein product [Cuscuta campestris]|uniref:Formamidopyrimidine-DNA glycosylase H2TH DNA-binding domain-containing protein n=1 Tax=Cuscuta campestris TaxID=132261 RepID=A0A484LAS0_9ASTE|nr:unnamed protein product [Cuscuta campestris]